MESSQLKRGAFAESSLIMGRTCAVFKGLRIHGSNIQCEKQTKRLIFPWGGEEFLLKFLIPMGYLFLYLCSNRQEIEYDLDNRMKTIEGRETVENILRMDNVKNNYSFFRNAVNKEFRGITYPSKKDLFLGAAYEYDREDCRAFSGMEWQRISGEIWEMHYDALYFMGAHSYSYFLPSLLISSMLDYDQVSHATSIVINDIAYPERGRLNEVFYTLYKRTHRKIIYEWISSESIKKGTSAYGNEAEREKAINNLEELSDK